MKYNHLTRKKGDFYKKEGFQKLKIFLIAILYVSIAEAIIFTSGIANLSKPWSGIAAALIMTIVVIFKLNLLTVVVEDNDILVKIKNIKGNNTDSNTINSKEGKMLS